MRKLFLSITFLMAISAVAFGANVDFTASAPNTVIEGNQFKLTYTINSNDNVKNFRAAPFTGLRHLAGPSQSTSRQVSVVNGQMTSSNTVKYTYVLMAENEGTFTIPEATIEVGGETYKSNALTVKVLKAGQAQSAQSGNNATQEKNAYGIGGDDLFVRTILSKTKVHQQEFLISTVKLYTRLDIRGFDNVKFPKYNGFLLYEIDMPEQLQFGIESINGVNYRTAVMKQSILFPQSVGKLEIEPAEIDCIIRLRTNRRSQSIFDDFFDSYQDVRKQVKSKAQTITVEPFPANRPESFSSLSGDFSMRSSVDNTTVKANEPVTLKIVISGNGNLKMIKTPELKFPGDFEVYDPKVTNELKNTTNGVVGSRTFEFLAIPRFAGEFKIPPYTFSYFDLQSNQYKTLSTPEYVIQVEKGSQPENTGVVTTFANKENVKFLGKDIRFIKTGESKLKPIGAFLFGSTKYWMGFGIPALMYLIIFVLLTKLRKERANVTMQKRKKANPVARKKLKTAQALMKEGKREAFFDEVLRALWGYVADKLSIRVADLNKENIRDVLLSRKASIEETTQFLELLNTCEFARFAPTESSGELENVYKLAITLIGRLESQIK